MQTNPAVEQNKKTLNGARVCRISPLGKEKVYGGSDLSKSYVQVLSSERKPERVIWEDASGDSEDGEEDDDELPCVIVKVKETASDEAREHQCEFRNIEIVTK